jgi:hypothetical protein
VTRTACHNGNYVSMAAICLDLRPQLQARLRRMGALEFVWTLETKPASLLLPLPGVNYLLLQAKCKMCRAPRAAMCFCWPYRPSGYCQGLLPVFVVASRIDGSIDVTTVCRFLAGMAGD